jgi:hypothetical protein
LLSLSHTDRSIDHLAFLNHFHYQGFEHNLNIVDLSSTFFFITNFGELGFFFFGAHPPRGKVFLLQVIILQVRKIVVLFSQEVFFNTRELA